MRLTGPCVPVPKGRDSVFYLVHLPVVFDFTEVSFQKHPHPNSVALLLSLDFWLLPSISLGPSIGLQG